MCTPMIGPLTHELVESYLQNGLGVSFKGLAAKWDSAEDVAEVVRQIGACDNLKYLELEGNTLGVDAAKAIGKALESKPELEAALWRDLFTGRLKNEIPQAMRYLFAGVDLAGARLQYLDLSDNAIGPLGMTGLAPFFKSSSSFSLKVLICNNNGLGPAGADEFSKALINCKQLSLSQGGEVFNLKVLVCGRNRMQDKGAVAISKFIKECTTLEEIYMPENSVCWLGQCALAEAYAANQKLRILNLNDNTITGKGTKKLAEVFKNLVYLEDLNLGDCLLRSRGALTIVNAIKGHKSLRKLVLDGNEIGKPAGIELAEILRGCKSVRHVSLSSNPFGIAGAETIGNILGDCEIVEMEDPEDSDYEEADEEEELEPEIEQEERSELEEEQYAGTVDGSFSRTEDNSFSRTAEYSSSRTGDSSFLTGDVVSSFPRTGNSFREARNEEEGEGAEEDDENYEDYGDDYEGSDGEGEDAVESVVRFLEEPTLENYDRIPGGLSEYVYDLEYLNIPPYEICIQGALGLVESCARDFPRIPAKCEEIFCKLMNEGTNFANNETNEFASTLLLYLGIEKSSGNEYYREEVCTPILECIAVWLIKVVDEKDVTVSDSSLKLMHDSFQSVPPTLNVDKKKLADLINYVLWRRNENQSRS